MKRLTSLAFLGCIVGVSLSACSGGGSGAGATGGGGDAGYDATTGPGNPSGPTGGGEDSSVPVSPVQLGADRAQRRRTAPRDVHAPDHAGRHVEPDDGRRNRDRRVVHRGRVHVRHRHGGNHHVQLRRSGDDPDYLGEGAVHQGGHDDRWRRGHYPRRRGGDAHPALRRRQLPGHDHGRHAAKPHARAREGDRDAHLRAGDVLAGIRESTEGGARSSSTMECST